MRDGQAQTFVSSLPTLLRIRRKAGMLRSVLGCAGQPRLHAVPDTDVPDLAFSVCPLDLLDSPFFRTVESLDQIARISPLADWPNAYAAWAVGGLMALRQEA